MSLRVRLLFNFPTYKVLAISIVSIIVGCASVALSVIGLVNLIWGHYVATGIWSGSVIAITGFFGIASAQTRGVCVVKTFMMFSIFSALVSFGVIALSIGGLIYNSKFYSGDFYRHPNTKLIHGLLLGTGILQSILSVICAVISIKHVCCNKKQKPGQSASENTEQNAFRRGDTRDSHSSSAPLITRQKRRSGSDVEHPSSSVHHPSDAMGTQPSSSFSENSRSLKHHRREEKSKTKKHHRSRSSENLEGKQGQRRNRDVDRNQPIHQRKRSPDRYANKPEAASARDSSDHTNQNQMIENEPVAAINIEFQAHTTLLDDMEGLPPYEEVIRDNEQENTLPFVQNDIMMAESISLSSHNDILNKPRTHIDNDLTLSKEVAAEQEALLCLSAALETPGTSLELDSTEWAAANRHSGDINTESEQLPVDLHIQNNNDEHEAPHLSPSAKRVLREKYYSVDPDPQGVIYKQFSRHSDVIKESINDDTKPKRSRSFQHTRERDFARGKSLSTRHLSIDASDLGNKQAGESRPIINANNFRPISKSFSRASGCHGKPPPKPPRTSSLRQKNGNKKERPKSATLPHSQFAVINIADSQEDDDTEASNMNKTNKTEITMADSFDDNKVKKIQPPRFRYPRPKLTNTTFQEYHKHPTTSAENEFRELCNETTSSPKSLSNIQTGENLSHSFNDSGIEISERLNMLENKHNRNLQLPIEANSTSKNKPMQSPLKSPTDLKDILLKGQPLSKVATKCVSTYSASSSSDEMSIDDTVDRSEAPASVEVELQERDDDVPTDSDGKPMYSFLL